MTIRRDDDTVVLENVCPVDDAEVLMQELLDGAALIDWSGCTHLHTACLQVILAAGTPLRGSPASPSLVRWVAPLLHSAATPIRPLTTRFSETANPTEA
jgi:hypothetical protein